MTVRATFTFRNQGGAPATGVRLRFNVPDGLVYLVGTGRLDGTALDDELGNSPLLSRGGADVGDVAPNEERRIEIAYSVAGAIENGTTIELQAAVASFELPPIGSNVVRLVARSKPQLANALTSIAIEAQPDPVPGSRALVTVRLHNAGESTARDVVVVSPIPEHASYVAGSAKLNGREIERELGAPFDRCYAPVVVRSLAARASATLSYLLAIDKPLAGGTKVVARATIASQETSPFVLEPAALTVISAPSFDDDRTRFYADPATAIEPGKLLHFELVAFNAGTASARAVVARLELPDELLYVHGAARLDGRPLPRRRKENLRFALGPVDADRSATLNFDAVVTAPLPDKTVLRAAASLEWEPAARTAERRLECELEVRAQPSFSQRRNGLARKGGLTVTPGAALEAELTLENDGASDAHDAVFQLRAQPPLEDLVVSEGGAALNAYPGSASSLPDTVELGTIEAYATRRLVIRARAPSPSPNGAELTLAAALHTRELGEVALAPVRWRVDSHPAFESESSRMELRGQPVLRPNQLAEVDLLLTNIGTETAQNVTLRCFISPEARLESVEGATRQKSVLHFGELAPGARARATLGLRLLRGLAKNWPVTVDAVLSADGMLSLPLERLTIATSAQPDFSTGTLTSSPGDAVELGETVEWSLHVRNGGDGAAHLVQVDVAQPDALIYVPNSTTVNDVPVRDAGALPPFATARGIVLNDVDPGVEATIAWRTVVHNALAAGATIKYVAHLRYDGERDDEIASAELTVRAGPAFANAIPGLPFGLDGMLGPTLGAAQPALREDRFLVLPPATPVIDGNGTPQLVQLAAPIDGDASEIPQFHETAAVAELTGTLLALRSERLSRTLRLLREARFGGLVPHLFALRAFLPERIGDARCAGLEPAKELLREELDRLFIKLRLPRYAIAPRDVETPSLRATLGNLLREAAQARGLPADVANAAIAMRGGFDPAELHDIGERLVDAPLAVALPWAGLARLLPDETRAFADYRARLIEALDAFEDSESDEFIDALAHARSGALEAALDSTIASLHAAA